MKKIFLCIALISIQALASININVSDHDLTNWEHVKISVSNVLVANEQMFRATIVKNSTYVERVYKLGMQESNMIHNIYWKPLSHNLTQVKASLNDGDYYYDIQVLNRYTGEVFTQKNRFQVRQLDGQAERVEVYSFVLYGPPVRTSILTPEISFSNSTELNYNPLALLWNKNLIDSVEQQALNVSKADANINAPRWNAIETDQGGVFAEFHNDVVKFTVKGYLYKGRHSYERRFWSEILVNPNTLTSVPGNHYLDRDWTPVNL